MTIVITEKIDKTKDTTLFKITYNKSIVIFFLGREILLISTFN